GVNFLHKEGSHIPTVSVGGGSISPNGFLPSILLLLVASSGWPFVSTVPGQINHLDANLTLDSARFCVMQGAFLTQGKASSIPIVFS
ncbi:hypothetical protein Tco_0734829, partial [Tanacetum coccineum]